MEKKEENKLYAVEQGLEISSGYKLLKIGFTPDQKPSEYSFADSTAAASNLEKMSMEFNKNEAIFTVYRENNSEKSISIGMMNVVGVNEHSEIADHKLDDVVEGYVVVLSNPNLSLETSRAPLNEIEYETVKNDLYKLNQALETVIAQLDQKKEKKFGIF